MHLGLGLLTLIVFLLSGAEPMAGRGRTLVSALGLHTLLAGVLVHVLAGRRRAGEP